MGRFSKLETNESAPAARPAPRVPERESGAAPVTFEDHVREADQRFFNGQYTEALRHYSRAVQENPQESGPWVRQVLCLLLQEQLREAGAWARRAVAQFPAHPDVVSAQGLVLALQGTAQRGLATSDYALGLLQPGAFSWVARGWILLESDSPNWRSCLDTAVQKSGGEEWRTRTVLGLVLERYRKWVQAAEQYEGAIALQASNPFLWHHLGICQKRMGFPTKAFESQRRALDLRPAYAAAERELLASPLRVFRGLLSRVGGLFWKR